MAETITLPADDASATPDLQSLLRGVEEGREYVITRGGRPVARLVAEERAPGATPPPVARRALTAEQDEALETMLEAMRRGWPGEAGRFSRDSLYEERLAKFDRRT